MNWKIVRVGLFLGLCGFSDALLQCIFTAVRRNVPLS